MEKIKINLYPSFHHDCTIEISANEIVIEIHPKLRSLEGIDKLDKLQISEFKKLKEIIEENTLTYKEHYQKEKYKINSKNKALIEIESHIKNILDNPIEDNRILLDGIGIECIFFQNRDFNTRFKYRSPRDNSKFYFLTKCIFSYLRNKIKSEKLLEYFDVIDVSYFGFISPWKVVKDNPLVIKIIGSLSVHEKEAIELFIEELPSHDTIVIDFSSFSHMGTVLYKSFEKLKNISSKTLWVVKEKESRIYDQLFEMGIKNNNIYFYLDEALRSIK